MAAVIEQELGLASDFVAGVGGIFEVRLDGETIFTNNNAGGVPQADIVIEAIRAAL